MVRRQDRSTIDTHDWKARIRPEIAHRANYRCECCGKFCGMHGHVDHIVPRADCEAAMIDPRDPSNLQLLCASCHNRKSAHEKAARQPDAKPPKRPRSNVPGRETFHAALGIAVDCKDTTTNRGLTQWLTLSAKPSSKPSPCLCET